MSILNKLTLNYLKLNKKRTIVTIIGIILSAAMLTAVTTLVVSFQDYLIKMEQENDGSWDSSFYDVKKEDIKYIENNINVTSSALSDNLGFSYNPYAKEDTETPFIYVKQYNTKAFEMFKIKLLDGRLPENENEIVISESYKHVLEKEQDFNIGNIIKLDIGKRIFNGEEILGDTRTNGEETLEVECSKEYKIVGIIKTPRMFENKNSVFISAITYLDKNNIADNNVVNASIEVKNKRKIYEVSEEIAKNIGMEAIKLDSEKDYYEGIKYNTAVLRYYGVSDNSEFNTALYSIAGIIILLIIVGSVGVIYNSFAISVSERKKQFGMLASIGTTKKQIKKSVMYEGVIVGLIGIPLGILAGIGGIGITLKVVDKLLSSMLVVDVDTGLKLLVSPIAIIVAIVFIIVTIALSILRPARAATKISPVDAIRQTDDIKIKAKKVRTNRLIRKVFGIEGEIALKNLKRSKKKYRTTVISLVISIVLFVTFSGFIQYMFNGTNMYYMTIPYDFVLEDYGNGFTDKALEKVLSVSEIDEAIEIKELDQMIVGNTAATRKYPSIILDENMVGSYIKDNIDDLAQFYKNENDYCIGVFIQSINNSQLEAYLKEMGLDSLKDNEAILIDKTSTSRIEFKATNLKEKDMIDLTTVKRESNEDDFEEKINSLKIVKVADKNAIGISNITPDITMIVNEDTFNKINNDYKFSDGYSVSRTNIYIKTEKIEEVESKLEDLIKETGGGYTNLAKAQEQQNNLKTIIGIFLYGFITLITLIGVSNVFNTISTNINLRRREFAMLKSIGMTKKGFNKMIYLESIFYGLKSLIIGLPIGILFCYLLYKAIAGVMTFGFSLPIVSIIICILAVFIIVFITMIYSIRKVKKDNIIDVLRQDNI